MKTIRVPGPLASVGAGFAISGLQFLSTVLPCAYAEDQDGQAKAKFFDWENLQSDVAGVADRTDPNPISRARAEDVAIRISASAIFMLNR
jgi:hypothetical protein